MIDVSGFGTICPSTSILPLCVTPPSDYPTHVFRLKPPIGPYSKTVLWFSFILSNNLFYFFPAYRSINILKVARATTKDRLNLPAWIKTLLLLKIKTKCWNLQFFWIMVNYDRRVRIWANLSVIFKFALCVTPPSDYPTHISVETSNRTFESR